MWRNQHLHDGIDLPITVGTAVIWNNTSKRECSNGRLGPVATTLTRPLLRIDAGTVRQSSRPRRLMALTYDSSRELARRSHEREGLGRWWCPKRLMLAHPQWFSHVPDIAKHPTPPEGWEAANGNTTRPPPADLPLPQPRL